MHDNKMPMISFIEIILLSGLIIASYTDIRTREVPDWLNYSLIILGFGLNSISSILQESWQPLVNSLVGFMLFFGIAWVMFYTGQWGGGDSKMLMALGSMLGIPLSWPLARTVDHWLKEPPILLVTVVMILLCGAVYGILWLLVVGIRHRKKVVRTLHLKLSPLYIRRAQIILASIAVGIGISIFLIQNSIIRIYLIGTVLIIIISFYLWIITKSVEEACMIRRVPPEKLTEGDWVVHEVIIEGKYICGPKDLGLKKEQIETLQKLKHNGLLNYIAIKYGIPFVPSFLIAFILTLIMLRILAF